MGSNYNVSQSQKPESSSKKKQKDHLKLFEKKMTQKFKILETTKTQMVRAQRDEEKKKADKIARLKKST